MYVVLWKALLDICIHSMRVCSIVRICGNIVSPFELHMLCQNNLFCRLANRDRKNLPYVFANQKFLEESRRLILHCWNALRHVYRENGGCKSTTISMPCLNTEKQVFSKQYIPLVHVSYVHGVCDTKPSRIAKKREHEYGAYVALPFMHLFRFQQFKVCLTS